MSPTVEIERRHLAALADYCRDDIAIHGLGDDDLEAATRAAYGVLDHEDPEL